MHTAIENNHRAFLTKNVYPGLHSYNTYQKTELAGQTGHFKSEIDQLTNQVNNQSLTSSTDMIQLTLTVKMTPAQVVKMSVTVNNSSARSRP